MPPVLPTLLLAVAASSVIDRTVRKEPAYQSANPTYCLLTFGPEAKDRVWLVRDGDALFVDRNGNGDLTDPGERVPSTTRKGYEEWGPRFEVPTLTVGGRTHANLAVGLRPLKLYADLSNSSPILKAAAKADPGGWVADLSIDVESPRFQGGQPGGRVFQMAGVSDLDGVLRFAARPADAPVVRFDGPLEVTFYGNRPTLQPGRGVSTVLCVGTPGLYGGTFAMLGHDDTIPAEIRPVLEVTPTSDGPKTPAKFELKERCCGVNLYGPVRVAADAPAGDATVVALLPGWPAGAVSPTTHTVAIANAAVAPSEPLSPKLVRVLSHPDRKASIFSVWFTPDGRLLAAGYPSGVVQFFDPVTGKELSKFETPKGYRGAGEYAHPTPDFRRLYVGDEGDKFVPADKVKGTPARREYDGTIMIWDLATGRSLPPIRPSEPRGFAVLYMSPDGTKMVTVERPSHNTDETVRDTTVLRDLTAGTEKRLYDGYSMAAFTPDGRTLAVTTFGSGDKRGRLACLDPATGAERWAVAADAGDRGLSWPVFSPDGKWLTVSSDAGKIYSPGELRVYDTATGAKLAAFPSGGDYPFAARVFSPDGRHLAAITYKNGLIVWDTATWKPARTFTFDKDLVTGFHPMFSPDGTMFAVPVARRWDDPNGDREPNPDDLPHTRVYLFDPASTASPEVLIGPRGYVGGAAFAPDGKTLAVGGAGGVALYDLSAKPARP